MVLPTDPFDEVPSPEDEGDEDGDLWGEWVYDESSSDTYFVRMGSRTS